MLFACFGDVLCSKWVRQVGITLHAATESCRASQTSLASSALSSSSSNVLRLATHAAQPSSRADATSCRFASVTSSSRPLSRAFACRTARTALRASSPARLALSSHSAASLHVTGMPIQSLELTVRLIPNSALLLLTSAALFIAAGTVDHKYHHTPDESLRAGQLPNPSKISIQGAALRTPRHFLS